MTLDKLLPAQRDELLRAFDDHTTFCRETIRIRDQSGSSVPVELYPGQLKLNAAIRKQRKRGKPVRLVVLKPRRTYFTAAVCTEIFHDVPFFPGRKALIVADKYKPAALEAFDYLVQFQQSYKPFERHGVPIKLPELLKDSEMEMRWEGDSGVDVLSAEGGDVGRGGGRHWLLADEVAFWRAPELTLTAVLSMVPYLPETAVVIQSTANGVGGEFYDLCQRAKDPANDSGFEFLFFSSLEHPMYRLPVEDKYSFQKSLDQEERDLFDLHNATLEWLAWRRKTIKGECRGKVEVFHQEYPTTPEEAFLTSGHPALDTKGLARMVTSPGMPGELEQVKEEGRARILFLPREHGSVVIWKKPANSRRYGIGADPSKGVDVSESKGGGGDPDYSVAFVIDLDNGEQVAMLRERLRPVPFAQAVARLGRLFNDAFLVPEANDAGFIDALLGTNYPVGMIYNRRRDPTDLRSSNPQEIGFETTTATRPWLVSALDDAIREHSISICSPVAVQECRTFVRKPNGKAEHQVGCHDDCVLAAALAVMAMRYAPKRTLAAAAGVKKYGKKKRPDYDD